MTQDKAEEDGLKRDLYDFLMDPGMLISKTLPDMNLHNQIAKLKGQDVSTINKLSNRAQYVQTSWHPEAASKYTLKMKGLIKMTKTYGYMDHIWGVHAHLSKVADKKSTASKAKQQVKIAQKHTNYEVSMTAEELAGLIDLDTPLTIINLANGLHLVSYSLCYALVNFRKISNGHSLVAEAHQRDISKPTHIIIPNTPKAECLVGMMNKNLPAFLSNMSKEQGLPEEFIDDLIKKSCKASLMADMHHCKWD
jgi:hypothetical protein